MKEYIERAAAHELVKCLPKLQMFNYDRTESLVGINPDDIGWRRSFLLLGPAKGGRS